MSLPTSVEKVMRVSVVAKGIKRRGRKEDTHVFDLRDEPIEEARPAEFNPEWAEIASRVLYEKLRVVKSKKILAQPVTIERYALENGGTHDVERWTMYDKNQRTFQL